MKKLALVALVVGALSLIIGIISRLTMIVIPIAPNGLEAQNMLDFTNTCLLAAIALSLMGK
jgi:hypothetical protein